MKVYPILTFPQSNFLLNISIPSNSDSLTYSNLDTPQASHFKRFQSTRNILQFSRSKDKSKNKRATTQPEQQCTKVFQSKNVGNSAQQSGQEKKKTVLEFDRTKFKRIKNKIEDRGIRRQNSKEFLLDLTEKKDISKVDTEANGWSKQRRSKNMSDFLQPRPRTIMHRPQASTGAIQLLSFTDRPKRSTSKSQYKPETLKQDNFNQNRSKFAFERKISFLKTETEQLPNRIEAEFEQFRKKETSLANSKKKRQSMTNIPLLQFTQSSKSKQQQPNKTSILKQSQIKKYEYSTFYDQQVNYRTSELKANTSRQTLKEYKQALNSYRSFKEIPQLNTLIQNSSRNNLRW